jgi:hypothetical protein
LQPKLLSHQDTHTYRLSNLLKISAAPFRLIRQQQRSEIMKHSPHPVKQFRKVFLQQLETSCPSTLPENPAAAEEVRII